MHHFKRAPHTCSVGDDRDYRVQGCLEQSCLLMGSFAELLPTEYYYYMSELKGSGNETSPIATCTAL